MNLAITEYEFIDKLKQLDAIHWYKKKDPLQKENYHRVGLSSNVSHLSNVFRGYLHKN